MTMIQFLWNNLFLAIGLSMTAATVFCVLVLGENIKSKLMAARKLRREQRGQERNKNGTTLK
jgi:hypothetical protein